MPVSDGRIAPVDSAEGPKTLDPSNTRDREESTGVLQQRKEMDQTLKIGQEMVTITEN